MNQTGLCWVGAAALAASTLHCGGGFTSSEGSGGVAGEAGGSGTGASARGGAGGVSTGGSAGTESGGSSGGPSGGGSSTSGGSGALAGGSGGATTGGSSGGPAGGSAGLSAGGSGGALRGGSGGTETGGSGGGPSGGSGGSSAGGALTGGSGGAETGGRGGGPSGGSGGSSAGGALTGGSGGSTEWGACQLNSECVVRSESCCGSCGAATRDDIIALNQDELSAYGAEVCDGAVACPACYMAQDPNLIATCEAHRCQWVDLLEEPVTECELASDCQVRTHDCCECGGGTDRESLVGVNINQLQRFASLVCDSGQGCDECMPDYPTEATADCEAGRCVVVWASVDGG